MSLRFTFKFLKFLSKDNMMIPLTRKRWTLRFIIWLNIVQFISISIILLGFFFISILLFYPIVKSIKFIVYHILLIKLQSLQTVCNFFNFLFYPQQFIPIIFFIVFWAILSLLTLFITLFLTQLLFTFSFLILN